MSTLVKLTVPEYDKIVASGVFSGKNRRRIELIWGELRSMNPIGSPHAAAIDWLNDWSLFAMPRGTFRVRIQNPVAFLDQDSEPQPDIVWAKPQDYGPRHPTADDVFLLIEVAESSLDFDRGEKAHLYAAAGILDYWIVNLVDRTVDVHRDSQGGQYRSVQPFGPTSILAPLAFPNARLDIAVLFADSNRFPAN